jgi:hypothetical protein
MTPIHNLVFVAAMAVCAAAQTPGPTGQNPGSGTAAPAVKPAQKTPAATPSKSSGGKSTSQPPPVGLVVPKTGTRSVASSTVKTVTKSDKAPKPPKVGVVMVKPAAPAGGKGAKLPPKKPVTAVVAAPSQSPVKVVPEKSSGDTKPVKAEDVGITAEGRRDPFVSIIRNQPTSIAGPNCSVGKRCLFIPELELKGIARDTDGQMMAVVVSNTHRAYFLRENDQVFNGSVQKITSDSVIFREFATDHLGRETEHEVVKKLPRT